MNNLSEKIIVVENLTKQFGHFTAVKGINFHVNKGEIFGFLGANGAGKTTAMKMLIGISNPTNGRANVAGFDVHTQSEKVKQNIGYMSQKFSMYDDLTVKENITFFGGIYGLSRKNIKLKMNDLLTELSLQDVANKLVGSLPLGWKQKLSFSIAYAASYTTAKGIVFAGGENENGLGKNVYLFTINKATVKTESLPELPFAVGFNNILTMVIA